MKSMILTIALALGVQAQAFTYTCDGMGNDKGSQVKLDIVSGEQVQVDGSAADLDPSYNPRLNHGLSLFVYEQSDEGQSEVLVADQLLAGSDKGIIKVQQRGEGFESEQYYCHP